MKEKFLCTSDLVIDGVLLCVVGKEYRVKRVTPETGETWEDVEGYCDILDCENGGTCMATVIDVCEHFEEFV